MYGETSDNSSSEGNFFFFFFPLLIVTFSNRMDSRGRTDGDKGVLRKKMLKDFCNPRSAKDGELTGLRWGESKVGGPKFTSGGKSESVKRGPVETTSGS